MWWSIPQLISRLGTPQVARSQFLVHAILEQGLCDQAIANQVTDEKQFDHGLLALRESAVRLSMNLLVGEKDQVTRANIVALKGIRFTARVSEPLGFQDLQSRAKWWPSIPECLGLHFRSLDDIVCELWNLKNQILESSNPLVVGIRSSGSILAPLVAGMRRIHRLKADYVTVRPCCRLSGVAAVPDLISLQRIIHHVGEVLIVDDPPTTGKTIAVVQSAVRVAGKSVSTLPIGQIDRGLRALNSPELGEYCLPGQTATVATKTRLASNGSRKTFRIGPPDLVLKPFGDPGVLAMEIPSLRALCPRLEYRAVGEYVSMRDVSSLPRFRCVADEQVYSLATFLKLYHSLFRVESISLNIWTLICRRRLGVSLFRIMDKAFSVDNLVRCNMALGGWHYLMAEDRGIVKIHNEMGHWSTVIDFAELVASVIAELGLTFGQAELLLTLIIRETGDLLVKDRLLVGLGLYESHIKSQITRPYLDDQAWLMGRKYIVQRIQALRRWFTVG